MKYAISSFLVVFHLAVVCHCKQIRVHFDENRYSAMEGDNVEFVCTSSGSVTMFLDSIQDEEIIKNGILLKDPTRYVYTTNETGDVHTLIIKNITRREMGKYICITNTPFDYMSLNLEVYYRASAPICVSSSQDLVFFTDEVTNRTVDFYCNVSDTGSSESILALTMFQDDTPIRRVYNDSLTFRLSVITNQTNISCVVEQEFPSSMNISTFKDSCGFLPILVLDGIEVTISPPQYVMNNTGNITFKCLSKAGFVDDFTWNVSPQFESIVPYTIENDSLRFYIDRRVSYATIYFYCIGDKRNHTSKAQAVLFVQKAPHSTTLQILLVSYITVFPSLVLFVLLGCLMYCMYDSTRSKLDLRSIKLDTNREFIGGTEIVTGKHESVEKDKTTEIPVFSYSTTVNTTKLKDQLKEDKKPKQHPRKPENSPDSTRKVAAGGNKDYHGDEDDEDYEVIKIRDLQTEEFGIKIPDLDHNEEGNLKEDIYDDIKDYSQPNEGPTSHLRGNAGCEDPITKSLAGLYESMNECSDTVYDTI